MTRSLVPVGEQAIYRTEKWTLKCVGHEEVHDLSGEVAAQRRVPTTLPKHWIGNWSNRRKGGN